MKKEKIVEILFYTAYTILLTCTICTKISYINSMKNYLNLLSALLLMLVLIIQSRKYYLKSILIFFSLLVASVVSYKICRNNAILFTLLIIMAAKKIKPDEFIKHDLYIKIFLVIFVLLNWKIGFSPDVTLIRTDGAIRHSLGFSHPNSLGLYSFCICAEIIYLNVKKMKLKDIITIIILILISHYISDSRAATLGILTIIVLQKLYNKKNIKKPVILIPIILVLTSFIIALMYNESNHTILTQLNSIMSGRIRCASNFIKHYKLNLWGNYFEYYGQWKTKGQYLTVLDNSYISLFLQYGLIMGTIMISTITLLIKKMVQEKNTKFLCFIISFLIFGLMENQMFNIMTNTTLIFISELIYNKQNNKIKE